MLCGIAAMFQSSDFDGATSRRRTSTQGEPRKGLNLFAPPSGLRFPSYPVPLLQPLITLPLPLDLPPRSLLPLAAFSSRHSATPAAAVPCSAEIGLPTDYKDSADEDRLVNEGL